MNKVYPLNIYMGYSRAGGSSEGAVLIFAHTVKEAKKIGWYICSDMMVDEYIDMAVNRLRNEDYLYAQADQEKLDNSIAHVIDNPKICIECETWGSSPIGDDGFCDTCRSMLEGETCLKV